MAQVAAYEDVKLTRKSRELPGGHMTWRTDFISRSSEDPDGPVAFLAESTPKRLLRTHFHEVDQFQIIALGGGRLAKHRLAFGGVHFARAFTPYGPIVNGEEGIGFITLRARRDSESKAQFIPECRERLAEISNRTPWQVTEMARFKAPDGDMSLEQFEQMRDDRGLAVYALTMKPHASGQAPAPGCGQYVVVTKGGLVDHGKEKKGLTVIWVGPNEKPFQLKAGADGLEAIVLNFPREQAPAPAAKAVTAKPDGELKVWQCVLCAFVYDEAAGMPEEGIPPGTRWADVPETFGCPDCDAKKADFEMIEF